MTALNVLASACPDRTPAVPDWKPSVPRAAVSFPALDAVMKFSDHGFLKLGTADLKKCVRLAREWLTTLETNSSKETPLQNLFTHIELAVEDTNEPSDILLQTLLRFGPREVPKWTPNGCRALGRIFEKMIKILFESAFPVDFEEGKKNARVSAGVKDAISAAMGTDDHDELKKPAKFHVDLLLRFLALEIKYRCANGQGATEQGRGAFVLRKAGFAPGMILLRASPNTRGYGKWGWLTAEAIEALELIYALTGIDFIAFMREVVREPKIQKVIDAGRQKTFGNAAKAITYQIGRYGPEFRQEAPAEMEALQGAMLDALSAGELDLLVDRIIDRSSPEALLGYGRRLMAASGMHGVHPA